MKTVTLPLNEYEELKYLSNEVRSAIATRKVIAFDWTLTYRVVEDNEVIVRLIAEIDRLQAYKRLPWYKKIF